MLVQENGVLGPGIAHQGLHVPPEDAGGRYVDALHTRLDSIFVVRVIDVQHIPGGLCSQDNAALDGLQAAVIRRRAVRRRTGVHHGNQRGVRNGLHVLRRPGGDGPGDLPGVVNILPPRQDPGSAGELRVIGVALLDGEARGFQAVHGFGEGDDIPGGSRPFKQFGFFPALHVLVFRHHDGGHGGPVFDAGPAENRAASDAARHGVGKRFYNEAPIRVAPDGAAQGKERLAEVVPGGPLRRLGVGKPAVQGHGLEAGF